MSSFGGSITETFFELRTEVLFELPSIATCSVTTFSETTSDTVSTDLLDTLAGLTVTWVGFGCCDASVSVSDSDDDDWLNICSARASELNGDFIEEPIGDLTAGGVGDFTGGFVANGLIGIFSGIIFF